MKRSLSTLAVLIMLTMILNACAFSPKKQVTPDGSHIKSVTAITEVFGDGQKLIAAAVEYDKEIDNAKLTAAAFSVAGRSITKAYVNNAAAKALQGKNGRYVILELSEADKNALTFIQQGRTKTRKEPKVSVQQTGDVITAAGESYTPYPDVLENNKVINLVVDDFKQLEYEDPKTGKTLKYNLFIPKNYNENKSYPLVTFIHDAGATSDVTDTTLIQGLGGVIWATPSEQAKRECFVLVPQYSDQIVNDKLEATAYLDITVDLINSIVSQYNLNKNRLYVTGQAGGAMLAIAMMIKYPDFFAAPLLVAGQWEPRAMTVLAKKNMWIIVAEGDQKAFSGMNAGIARMETAGAKVSKAIWNGQAGEEELASEVRRMIGEGRNIKYTVLKKGTVVPAGQADDADGNHINIWRIAYAVEGLRDWLFTQAKGENVHNK
ncbi:PHB depolymerase family esterase [Sporomusa termitida]|uniref:Esterase Ig-like N-terminal domain-containing protein n=1 Tax=Sporomusa termitida TaxID=2377 RepID=A0A517DZK7_9FIRM|nr:PHB depolymerase family esterase [Sporomusa termitida]QDR82686.1 hypothetical protein SPTER_41160 [Sporomusa termitida]